MKIDEWEQWNLIWLGIVFMAIVVFLVFMTNACVERTLALETKVEKLNERLNHITM